MIHRGPDCIQLCLIHGHPLADGAQVVERATKCLAGLGIGQCEVDRFLGGTDAHADQDHPLVLEVLHDFVEATMGRTQEVVAREPHTVEHQLGRVR